MVTELKPSESHFEGASALLQSASARTRDPIPLGPDPARETFMMQSANWRPGQERRARDESEKFPLKYSTLRELLAQTIKESDWKDAESFHGLEEPEMKTDGCCFSLAYPCAARSFKPLEK